jgi:hypothetical protein
VEWIIAIAAAVQAITAIVIATLTVRLKGLTKQALARQTAMMAPSITVHGASRSTNDPHFVEAELEVSNLGGVPATNVVARTDWADGSVPGTLSPGGKPVRVTVRLPKSDWDGTSHPVILGSTFTDLSGQAWEQDVHGSPRPKT